jgi:hypothetical protein
MPLCFCCLLLLQAQRKEKKRVETLDEWQFEFEAGKTGHRFAKVRPFSFILSLPPSSA